MSHTCRHISESAQPKLRDMRKLTVPIAKSLASGVEYALWAAIAVALYDRDWLLAGLLVGANALLVISSRRGRAWPDEVAYWVLAGAMIRAHLEGEEAVFFLAAPRALTRDATMLLVYVARGWVSDFEEVSLGAIGERYADALLWFIRRGTAARRFAWGLVFCVGIAWPTGIFWVAYRSHAWVRWPYLVVAGGFILAWVIASLHVWPRGFDAEEGRRILNSHLAIAQAAAARRAKDGQTDQPWGSPVADELKQRNDVDGLLALLHSDDTMARFAATSHLVDMRVMRAVDPLRSSLDEDDLLIRMNALRALGKLGATQFADDIFLIAATDENRSIRAVAVATLDDLDDPRTVQAFRSLLQRYTLDPRGSGGAFIKWTTQRLTVLDGGAEAIPELKAAITQAKRRDRRRLRRAITALRHGQPAR